MTTPSSVLAVPSIVCRRGGGAVRRKDDRQSIRLTRNGFSIRGNRKLCSVGSVTRRNKNSLR
ncbi:hypothetical protein HCA61_01970 [Rhodococcus sp. HNM0563]|uniref:hypothetical protein n=1 Tax=unclassified Rhodococcus (in: high G+C Gram-positive bacteria) TaxID=192944 RepID=UPI00146EF279|nr:MULTISPECIES: hypothetical protein [unclassified Rhodococcus (in: high G+C Gram-positive bacteria)]MCK0090930.1 hypothetical protein [Rhodococcus sp. F64268]NLU61028.1 hypothetical protein [Rhodococcus sp. HNM0563]